MQSIIVADTSCLIIFHKIGELALLNKVFGQITITESIAKEFGKPLPEWINVLNSKTEIYQGLSIFLDLGEATAIALAMEYKGSLLILDDLKGRKIANDLGLAVTGSLGVLVAAKVAGHIHR